MKRQLVATESAANAALAALARPWLLIVDPKTNYVEWIKGSAQMQVSFTISNYGNAPAVILNIKAVLFLGEHHNAGTPEHLRPHDFLEFPDAHNFERFVLNCGRHPGTKGKVDGEDRTFFLPEILSQVVPINAATEPLVLPGPRRIDASHHQEIAAGHYCDIYFLGAITYRVPSEGLETINFCFRKGQISYLETYRDYAPYNQRQKYHPVL